MWRMRGDSYMSIMERGGGCVAAIGAKLNKLVKEDAWSIDLKSPDKTLTITTDLPAETILSAVSEAGFKASAL
jgi:copper chaperone